MENKVTHVKNIVGKISKVFLALYIVYGVMQTSTLSMVIGNDIIIALLFVLLAAYLLLTVISKNISLLPTKKKDNIWKYLKPMDFAVAVFLLANAVWILIVPKMNGFSMSGGIAEAGMLILFILYFPLAFLIRLGEIDFKFIVKVFFWSSFALAIFHIVFWFGELFSLDLYAKLLKALASTHLFNTGEFIKGWGIVRVVFTDSVLLIPGLLLIFSKKGKLKATDFIMVFVFTFAVLTTFLKSIWFGVIAAVLLMLVYGIYAAVKKKEFNPIKIIAAILISAIVLNFTVFGNAVSVRLFNAFINSSDEVKNSVIFKTYDIFAPIRGEHNGDDDDTSNSFDSEKDIEGAIASNDDKIEQIGELVNRWKQSPLTGFGYGSSVPGYYRNDINQYAYEMTIPSMLMKLGVLGLAVWGLLVVYAIFIMLKSTKKNRLYLFLFLAVLGGFFASIQTNPLLLSANSLNLIMYILLCCEHFRKKQITDKGEDLK